MELMSVPIDVLSFLLSCMSRDEGKGVLLTCKQLYHATKRPGFCWRRDWSLFVSCGIPPGLLPGTSLPNDEAVIASHSVVEILYDNFDTFDDLLGRLKGKYGGQRGPSLSSEEARACFSLACEGFSFAQDCKHSDEPSNLGLHVAFELVWCQETKELPMEQVLKEEKKCFQCCMDVGFSFLWAFLKEVTLARKRKMCTEVVWAIPSCTAEGLHSLRFFKDAWICVGPKDRVREKVMEVGSSVVWASDFTWEQASRVCLW